MVDSLLLVLNNNFNTNISSVDSISHEVMRTAKLLKNDSLIAELHFIIGQRLHSRGEYPKSYNNFMQALQIFERKNDFYNTAKVYRMLGESNRATNNFELATKFLDKSIEIFLKLNDSTMLASTYNRKAAVYYEYFKIDSMLKYIRLSNDMIDTSSSNIRIMSNNFNILGAYYMREGSFNEALHNY
ncbi:MAG: tetratricopeptide repeat protein, partial [Candidatus Kapabacteria bacterium]|nr:tetratricopeptide repeat protein [Candidatus Kapabacteria bacterium]